MANLRNEFEFRSGLLDALGVEHTEADAKNEERWRSKMLDGLGVEYNQNDVNQFDLFRAKLLEGVESMSEGGGGSSDFSTATMTITGTTRGFIYVPNVLVVPDYNLEGAGYQSSLTDDTLTVILYKGKAYAIAGATVQSISGNITYDADLEWYVITGDCTVNFS